MTSVGQTSWINRIASFQDSKQYAELNWEGSFEDYLASRPPKRSSLKKW